MLFPHSIVVYLGSHAYDVFALGAAWVLSPKAPLFVTENQAAWVNRVNYMPLHHAMVSKDDDR
jgi:hypothetical protein